MKSIKERANSLVIRVEVVADIASQASEEHRLLPVVPQCFDRFDDHRRLTVSNWFTD